METKKCKYCKEEIDKNAKRCPKCGGKFGLPLIVKILIVIFIIITCVVACVGGCSKAVVDGIEESFSGYDDINNKKSFNVGETFESKYLKITFVDFDNNFRNYNEYATIADGYKIVKFVFTAENIGEESQTFDYTDFDCYADDETMQQFYSVDDAGLDSGGTVSSGKKATVPVYCEVPNDASKITVEFKPFLADNTYEFISK